MKKISWLIGVVILLMTTGCFETVEESSINDDGSGVFSSSMDMSKMIALAKNFGGDSKELKEAQTMKKDTVINLKDIKDSLQNLSPQEKKILDKATLKILMSIPDEQFTITFNFPYSRPADLETIASVLKKAKRDMVKNQLNGMVPGGEGSNQMGNMGNDEGDSEISDYYICTYEKGHLTKKLNKEKYANLENDKSMKTLQEMGQMGMPVDFKTIINLPRAAKKAEGKGVKLSDDRKKVTIEGNLDDFFEDASKFEYNIEY